LYRAGLEILGPSLRWDDGERAALYMPFVECDNFRYGSIFPTIFCNFPVTC
jgi:hypothetical protein